MSSNHYRVPSGGAIIAFRRGSAAPAPPATTSRPFPWVVQSRAQVFTFRRGSSSTPPAPSGTVRRPLRWDARSGHNRIFVWRHFPQGGGAPNTYTISPSGGVTFAGNPALIRTRAFLPTGGVVFGGTAPITTGASNTYTLFPTGGVSFAGASPFTRTRTLGVSGGFSLTGDVGLIRTRITLPTGGVIFSGNAPMIFIPAGSGAATTSLALMGVGQ